MLTRHFVSPAPGGGIMPSDAHLRVSSRPRARGFSLIELLVVIAIIAILAAVLFPVFCHAKESFCYWPALQGRQ